MGYLYGTAKYPNNHLRSRGQHWFIRSHNVWSRSRSIYLSLCVRWGCQWIMERHFLTHSQTPFGKLHPLRPHHRRIARKHTRKCHDVWSSTHMNKCMGLSIEYIVPMCVCVAEISPGFPTTTIYLLISSAPEPKPHTCDFPINPNRANGARLWRISLEWCAN